MSFIREIRDNVSDFAWARASSIGAAAIKPATATPTNAKALVMFASSWGCRLLLRPVNEQTAHCVYESVYL
jgi:hypothetical protein